MRILFTRFPLESRDGGAENHTEWLMKALVKSNLSVQFLGSCPTILGRASKLKIENVKLKIGPPPVTKFGVISFFWRKQRMKNKIIDAIIHMNPKPDVLVMLSMTEKLLLTEWGHEQGIKVFWIEHDRIGRWLRKNPWLPQLVAASQDATTICVSDLSRKKYLELGWDPKKTIAIPNGVPPVEKLQVAGSKFQVPSSTLHTSSLQIGCISRLSEDKGVDLLLDAVSTLPQVSLRILGTGPMEGVLRTAIQEDTRRHGAERITLESRVEDIGSFYQSIDALVLPSEDHDPFGLVVAEAMMYGLPVITTDQTGISGYLQDKTDALIVPAGSSRALQEAISLLLDSEKRSSLGVAAAETAKKKFSLQKMIDAYVTIFSQNR